MRPVYLGEVQEVVPVLHVVDTTAAGDCFNAGYLTGVAIGEPATDAMHGDRIWPPR